LREQERRRVKNGRNSKPQGNLRPAITADKPETHLSRAVAAGVVALGPYNTAAGPARGGEGGLPAPVVQENEEDSDPYNLVISDIFGESQSTISPEGQPEPELPEAHEGPEFSVEELEKLLEVLDPGNAQNKQTAKDIHESPLPPAPVEIGGEIWPEGEAPLYNKTGALCQKRKHSTTTGSSSTSDSSTDNFFDLNVTESSGPKKKKTKAREDTEDRTEKKVEQEAGKLKDQVEALEYMKQRLKINGELRDKTLKI
jgi:hypothetical protein